MNEIDLNKSNKEALTKVKGIGLKKAERIIAYRKDNGLFNSIDELLNIKGFASNNFSRIKNQIKVTKKTEIIFIPEDYNLNQSKISEVHLVGEMNNWNPKDKTYSLTKRKNGNWKGSFPLKNGIEYKIMYDSQKWEANQYIGDGDKNFVI